MWKCEICGTEQEEKITSCQNCGAPNPGFNQHIQQSEMAVGNTHTEALDRRIKWLWFFIGLIPVVPILISTAAQIDSLGKQLTWFFGMAAYIVLSILASIIMLVVTRIRRKGSYIKPLASGILLGVVIGFLLAGVVCK